jgi:hypothetical protein
MLHKFYIWFLNKLAIWRMKKRYYYLIEVNKILQEFITNEIIKGGSDTFIAESRKQLLANQNETKTHERFIEFLKTL